MSVYRSEIGTCLDQSLRSIWTDQTLRPEQIVLVEDGPLSQELYDVIDKWQLCLGSVLTVLRNETNLGLTKSLNRALSVAEGDYIARMDADDLSLPNRFEVQKAFLDANPNISVVGGALQEFDSEHDCLNVRHYPQTSMASRQYIHKASPLAHPAVMMRRKIFDDGLSYDERYRVSQDIALWFDVLCAGYEIANVPNILVKFRKAGDVFKRRGRAKAFNEFKIYMKGIKRMNGLCTFKYFYPCARLVFRLMPRGIIKAVYNSPVRRRVLEK